MAAATAKLSSKKAPAAGKTATAPAPIPAAHARTSISPKGNRLASKIEFAVVAAVLCGTAITAVEIRYGSTLVSQMTGQKEVSFPQSESCGKSTLATCKQVATEIKDAVRLWLEAKKRQKVDVPAHINLAYALKVAAVESAMGSLPDDKKSSYSGTFQMSRNSGDHFTMVAEDTAKALSAVKLQLPYLYGQNRIDAKLLMKDDFFSSTTTQLFAMMEMSLRADRRLRAVPDYAKLPEHEKHVALYLNHNLPVAVRPFLQNSQCETPIGDLMPEKFRNLIKANPAVYGRMSEYNSAEISFAFYMKTNGFVQQAATQLGDPALADSNGKWQPRRSWQYGVASSVTGYFMKFSRCTAPAQDPA